MVFLPHLRNGVASNVTVDFRDQLRKAELDQSGNVAWYAYDSSGQRVRKLWDKGAVREERIYVGPYEVWRRRNGGGAVQEERTTLHVMDDERRIAMAETLTRTGGAAVPAPVPRLRYQLDDHLGTALLEVDDTGAVITYEEYHPYGTTAWYAEKSAIQVSAKRYRYTGKERDEETGLSYHGARYYAPWLGRWIAADPAGMVDGPNRCAYVGGNPVGGRDPTGLGTDQPQKSPHWTMFEGDDAPAALRAIARGDAAPERIDPETAELFEDLKASVVDRKNSEAGFLVLALADDRIAISGIVQGEARDGGDAVVQWHQFMGGQGWASPEENAVVAGAALVHVHPTGEGHSDMPSIAAVNAKEDPTGVRGDLAFLFGANRMGAVVGELPLDMPTAVITVAGHGSGFIVASRDAITGDQSDRVHGLLRERVEAERLVADPTGRTLNFGIAAADEAGVTAVLREIGRSAGTPSRFLAGRAKPNAKIRSKTFGER